MITLFNLITFIYNYDLITLLIIGIFINTFILLVLISQ